MQTQAPLTTLLSWTWISQTIEADNAFEAACSDRVRRLFPISLPMWANAVRFITEAGASVADVERRAGASCNLGGLERWGWISIGAAGADRRIGYGTRRGIRPDTVLRPTRAGVFARRTWPRVVEDVERRWVSRFGRSAVDGLRTALLPAADRQPWSPPEVGPGDGFRTPAGAHGAAADGPGADGEPAEGPRPLAALLGQAVTNLTRQHERRAALSLPLAANALRVLGPDPVPPRDLPMLTGLSKEGVAMSVSYLRRHDLVAAGPERALRLTAAGAGALAEYRRAAGQFEDAQLRAALLSVLGQTEALSAGLVPPVGGWRAEKPYLAQTSRRVADPTGALPWHPMVLHRGGWPDAS